jgi:hypothetical protein
MAAVAAKVAAAGAAAAAAAAAAVQQQQQFSRECRLKQQRTAEHVEYGSTLESDMHVCVIASQGKHKQNSVQAMQQRQLVT